MTKLTLIILLSLMPLASAQELVILLHGLSRTSKSMNKMESHLSAAGFSVLNLNYPSDQYDIETLSEEALTTATNSPLAQQCSRIHYVTHSMGGILVRSYYSRHPIEKVGRVVMLAPPNQGSEVVDNLKDWWLFKRITGPAGGELSTQLTSTPNRLGPVTFPLGVISGDRSINWINSLMIPGPDDGKVSIERTKISGMTDHLILHTTHPFIMKNDTVIQQTLSFLKNGHFLHP